MKKALLFLASTALLLVSCAKEKFAEPSDGDLTNVTFTANVDGGVATKAFADGDGNGAFVNRCIMEIYYGDALYKRLVEPLTGEVGTLKATFANVPVVAGKQYKVLFWADHVDNYDTADGLATDKYYDTHAGGLKAVQIKKESFIDALEDKTNDYLDAFFFADNYTISQNQTEVNAVVLKRPFAQLNVITTDVGEGKTVTSADLLPEKVSVSYKADNTINVATGAISKVGEEEDYTFTYEADVYGAWSTVTTDHKELTLSMDYILASTEQAAVDVTFITKNGDQTVMTHSLANLPYKRNYRTNVKGDLLTTAGTWKAEIEPDWSSPDIVKVVEVADIKSANEIINQYKETTDHLEVKFTGEPSDSGEPAGEAAGIRAIVTTPIKEGNTLSIEVLTETKKLYIGDYKNEYIVSGEDFIDTDNSKHAVVNVNVPEESSITTLVINAPSKSVYINGKEVANVGTITDLDAITSQNTLIIEKGQTVNKLTIRQGGLEIHGTVGQAVVPEGHGTIVVRDCENLKETEVYDVLKAYIAEGYVGVKGRTTADLWDIVPEVCKIGTESYGTLIDAVAAVQSGGTINLVRDYEGDGVVVPGGKNFTLDFGGHTYKVIGNMAGSAGTQNQCFQLLKGSTLVFQNGTITTSCAKLGINTYSDVTIKNVTIDMSQTEATGQVACLETCNGTVSVEGESNLITKEDQIATLVLYWPNGGYGDIDVTINTTGEVNGLMAYGSYQVQDLSTVAQHSHVAIKNGKYDVTFDMDELESYDYKISGGIFTNKPDESLVADKYEVTENTDVETKAQYPYTVGRKGVAQIGTTIYYDLKDAIDAVPVGTETETMITMLDNVSATATFTIPSDKNICLELNGKSIFASSSTSSQGFPLFANKGIFTVQDNTDTHKDGTGTGRLSTIAYDPDMRPVPGYATNTITNYGTLNIKSGLVESGSNGMASFAIDNEAENAQWHNSSNKTITLNVSGGRIISGQSYSIRMYLATNGQYDNIIKIDNAHIGSLWVQDNYQATAAKGSLKISNSTFDKNLLIGYYNVSEHFSLNVSNSVFEGKLHYQLNSEHEGNVISIDNISAAPFFMDSPKRVLHNGTVIIKGEFPWGWFYAENDKEKAELEAYGLRLEQDSEDPNYYYGYLSENGILDYLKECIITGYEAVCVDQAAGKYEIRPVQN